MNFLQRSTEWLQRTQRKSSPVEIVYRRGALYRPITASIGKGAFEQDDGDGGIVSAFTSRDYFIAVADFAPFDEPQEGDEIDETINGKRCTFQVVSPGGEQVSRFSDPGRTQYRVHTQEIG